VGRKHGFTGHRVPRPEGAVGTLSVYRNGHEVAEGVDFELTDEFLVFREPLHNRATGFLGRLQMTTVGIGVYDSVDKVDIHATSPTGEFRMFAELKAIPD
jgi:hypothetical protein